MVLEAEQNHTPLAGPPQPPEAALLARARAALLAGIVLFNVLAAVPTPGEPSLERLQRPFERAELQRWTELFRGIGVDTDADRVAEGYLEFSRWLLRARELALAPIAGWMELTQTQQSWRLFGTPDRAVSALRVTAHSDAGSEVLYQSGRAELRWGAQLLEYRRVRALYNPSRRGPPPTYAAFGKRLSDEIFAALPHVSRVTVALVGTRVRLPGEPAPAPSGTGERFEHVLEFERPPA